MSENRKKKELAVKEAIANFKDSPGIIITDFQGLTVEKMNKLRRDLEKAGATYKVIKNTVSKKVLAELNINGGLKELFTGVTGIVFAKEYVSAIKILKAFEKDSEEKFKIKGGYLDSKSTSLAQITEISKLSSKEELIAKLVFMLNQPVVKFVRQLAKPKADVVYVLNAVKGKK